MAPARLRAALVLGAIQAASAESNFMYTMMKKTMCSSFKVPFICSGSDKSLGSGGSVGSSDSGSSSKCSGDSCCAGSSCYALPGMGCDSSRGSVRCAGASLPMTAGQCQCKGGNSCSQGTCASGGSSIGSSMMSDLSDLFEEDQQAVHITPEDHSRALALYTGGACLLVVAGLSAGVRKLRRARGSVEGADERELEPRWDLLSQVSSSGE
ncbi:unnamed protein product [Prorocentrum cordatum]|uniref:Uncharacterized protein n=1 Tax=Prorocentrum cordatum TaxID=2364126 RepID=A0ABN9QDD8_9DINO|nr:unnamed protein product [Polarella glacialis]